MISLKASVKFADDHLAEYGRMVVATGHLAPEQFVQTYRKHLNANDRTPAKSFRLRRSVRYQVLGNQAIVRWLAPYAAAQEAGTSNGRVYRNYTKPGTGRGFGQEAFRDTQATFMADFAANHPEYTR